jgi:hypothetical protein
VTSAPPIQSTNRLYSRRNLQHPLDGQTGALENVRRQFDARSEALAAFEEWQRKIDRVPY